MRLNKELLAAFVAIRGDGRVSIPLGYFGNLCPAVVAMEISTIVLLRVHCNRFSHTPKCTFFSFLQRNTTRLHFALAQGLSLDFRVACGSIIFTLDRHKCFFLIPQFSSQIWQLFPRVLFVPTVFGKVSSSLSAFRAWIFSTTCQYYSSLSARGRPASLSFYNEKGHNFLLDPTALSLLELGLRLRRFHSSSADREAKSTTWPVIFQSIDYFDTLTSTCSPSRSTRNDAQWYQSSLDLRIVEWIRSVPSSLPVCSFSWNIDANISHLRTASNIHSDDVSSRLDNAPRSAYHRDSSIESNWNDFDEASATKGRVRTQRTILRPGWTNCKTMNTCTVLNEEETIVASIVKPTKE